MNQHTPGPVTLALMSGVPGWEGAVCRLRSAAGYIGEVDNGNTPTEAKANAALLAASYTMTDRAARELGIEALDLCKIDLAALLRAAHRLAMLNDRNPSYVANLGDARSEIAGVLMPLAGQLHL